MDPATPPPADAASSAEPALTPPSITRILGLALASAVLFAVGLELTETVGEFALDVDLKPFFLPYLLIAFVRFRISTLAVATGAAVGEGVLDMFEGFELEDPLGFFGYFFGFAAFGWYLNRVADDPSSARSQTVAAVLGAFVQALFEGVAFFLFEPGTSPASAVVSVLGNTVTHGVVLGLLPLLVLYPYVQSHLPHPLDVAGG